jgi:hypothetical protein
MTCTGYNPPFGAGQLDGSTFAGSNCNCWSAARANTDDTCGKEVHSASNVRVWAGDTVGGTNLSQVDAALNAHTSTRLDVRYRYPFASFLAKVRAGQGAILQGGYAPIADSRFDAGGGFRGNHSVYVPADLKVMDPLADGRRAGIYKFHGEVYPTDLLERFAGHLNLEARAGQPAILLGNGLVYAAFTRDNDANYRVTIRPRRGETRRAFVHYFVTNGRISGHETRRTGGFTAACTAPANLLTSSGTVRVSVVRITSGSYAGFWVSSGWSDA